MRHLILPLFTLAALAVVGGCDRRTPAGPAVDAVPPSGNARFTDGDGRDRTAFRPIGVIHYGERVEDRLAPAEALVGYEFAGGGGDRPELILDVAGGARASMALYGPRAENGLWDRPLSAIDGSGVLRLPPVELPADGHYFVLLRRLEGAAAGFALQLTCPGCGEPPCRGVEACDLFCDQGYAVGDDGCRVCGCDELPCAGPEDCLGGEVCAEGQCRPAPGCDAQCVGEPAEPVCGADGSSYPNACVAMCRGVEVVAEGPCAEDECRGDGDCADPLRCIEGRCMCDCPRINAPVCGISGTTHANICVLECAGDAFAYVGECDRIPPPRACGDGVGCPFGQICVGGGDAAGDEGGGGICAPTCPVRDPGVCGRRAVCADLGQGERGACLPACMPDRLSCPDELACLPDLRGRLACFPCECEPGEGEAVCADGRLDFDSACAAGCAGFGDDRVRAGACDDPGPEPEPDPEPEPEPEGDCAFCRDIWAPVCAEGLLWSSGCDAACERGAPPVIERGEACFVDSPRVACRDDGDCSPEACARWACGAGGEGGGEEGCPPLTADAQCFVDLGMCGCLEGACGYRPRRGDVQLAACLDRSRVR